MSDIKLPVRRCRLRRRRVAARYSLVGTWQLKDMYPEAYLRRVFERNADRPINHIEKLLLWNVALAPQAAPNLAA